MSSEEAKNGPGYPSPLWAYENGPREKILYVANIQPNLEDEKGDYLSVVDVDPESQTYCQVIHRAFSEAKGQEFHHMGWNTCSSRHCCQNTKRNKLILPCLNSDAIYVFDVEYNLKKPKIHKVNYGEMLRSHDVSAPHTVHCLPSGNLMISTLGDKDGNAKGDFILLDKNFDVIGTWSKDKKALCGYDFWYQPYFDVLIGTEWGAPKLFRKEFSISAMQSTRDFGQRLNVYSYNDGTLLDTIDLGMEGKLPLEIRFLHNPKRCEGFVGCAFYSNMFYFYKKDPKDEKFTVKKVIDVPAKKVEGWYMPELYGMMVDLVISLDDRFLYFSNWFHGDVRQYDISDPLNPRMTGQIFLGGMIHKGTDLKLIEDEELKVQPEARFIKGRQIFGGPQMLQLSLDGKRLYVSNSFYSPWDKMLYPDLVKNGSTIVQIDIDTTNGGMTLNENFLVDFGKEPNGPVLAHEMRYPGGDCTSDIWLADDNDNN
ncbi:hypothetical protein PVAND_001422 [Polypedilum vanderplanki]|uniref:Selenium-binding protein n=1 Tax=Polypedilum vanderplanki TaxID=319348 RepID=A0A9J6BP77_POLVA|nr:hypothetical protein PVAND_001420 [Polypedilum vanderplanki]KAG5671213.1 hypothetical protein PVAND_001422 [Polypedilum vanderplanki]